MSLLSQEGLKEILQQLECHFTWELQKEHIDPDELEERIVEQIQFLINKSKVRNYNLLAYVKFLNDKKDEALENLQKAEETLPLEYPEDVGKESLVTWGNCAWVHYHMGSLTESQAYLEKVESICKQLGSESPYKMELPQIYCDKGWALLKFGARYYERAKESFEKALEKEPENPEFNSGYAITVYRIHDHFAKNASDKELSLEPLKLAVKLNPDDVFVVPLLAINLQETGNVGGEKWIKEALQKHPDVPYVLRYAAKFYRKKGDVDTALQHLKKALSLTPNAGFLYHQIGLCYRAKYLVMKNESRSSKCQAKDKMEKWLRLSIFFFEKVVERKPRFFYANIDLAKMYAEQRQLQKADETYQKLFTKINSLTPLEKQQLHFNYGRFQEFERRSQSEAIKHYLAALKIEFNSSERDKCKPILKKLMENKIRKGEADAENFAILGFIHQLNGEEQQALKAYEEALNIDPGNEEYFSAVLKLKLSL